MIGQDLLDWLEDWTTGFIDDHLETWKERYYRMMAEQVEYDLSINYDWSADLEWAEQDIGRELNDDEKEYFVAYFTKAISENFYRKG